MTEAVVSSFPTPTGEIMRSYLNQIDVIYNDINAPIGSGGCIVEKYPDWLEDNTLWKVNTRNKSFPVRFQVPAYYELAKASYLELFEQDSLPEWTKHQFKRYDNFLSNIVKKRLHQFLEEERKIQEEDEDEDEEKEDLLIQEFEFNEADLDEADLIEADLDFAVLNFDYAEEENIEEDHHWLFRYLSGLFSL